MSTQMITPCLWLEKDAREAAEFYVAAFGWNSQIDEISTIYDTPGGTTEIANFILHGQAFMAFSPGSMFQINPSISFHIRCKSEAEVAEMWDRLSPGGTVLMELGKYPFSKKFGWIQDRYGVSWQVIHTEGAFTQSIMPALMFTGEVCGRAEEALDSYMAAFAAAEPALIARYAAGEEPNEAGTVKLAQFSLAGQEFGAMDSAYAHQFTFNEAVSLVIHCRDQAEIDHFWDRLSAVPEAEQCGWAKDSFGVSWQIVPANMSELMAANPAKTTPAMLAMKKIVIEDLVGAGASDDKTP